MMVTTGGRGCRSSSASSLSSAISASSAVCSNRCSSVIPKIVGDKRSRVVINFRIDGAHHAQKQQLFRISATGFPVFSANSLTDTVSPVMTALSIRMGSMGAACLGRSLLAHFWNRGEFILRKNALVVIIDRRLRAAKSSSAFFFRASVGIRLLSACRRR